jgi:ribosomal-protein-alanine N-acetyltransferase
MRKPLLTSRLVLRDITLLDAELLFELDSDPEVMKYIGPRPALDLEWYRDRIRTVYMPQQAHSSHGVRIVLDRESGEFLGWVFIRQATASIIAREIGWFRPDEVEVGYRFRRSAWGRGIATEAAAPLVELALTDSTTTAVVACASAGNAGSLRVLQKLGLDRVGEVLLSEASMPTIKLTRVK